MNLRAACLCSTSLLLFSAATSAAPVQVTIRFRSSLPEAELPGSGAQKHADPALSTPPTTPTTTTAARPRAPRPPLGYLRLPSGVLPIAPPLFDPRPESMVLLLPLDALPPGGATVAKPPAEPVELKVFGQRVSPAQVVVAVGTQIAVRNDDRLTYTLGPVRPTAGAAEKPPSAAPLFEKTALPPGERVTATVTEPGEHPFAAKDQPHVTGLVVGLRHGEQASRVELSTSLETGTARFDVPAGRYAATLVLGRRVAATQTVTVTGRGGEATLEADLEGAP